MNEDDPQYQQVLAATYVIVNGLDPMGLLEMGCPEDEYEYEVVDYARLVLGDAPIDDGTVAGIWMHWFGEMGDLKQPEVLAALTSDLNRLRATERDHLS